MNSLPLELVLQILSHLPPSSSKHARLVCRRFNDTLAKPAFSILASFLDERVATSTLQRMAADLRLRPRAIWSPNCSVPKGLPVPTSFLMAVHVAIRGTPMPMSSFLGGGGNDAAAVAVAIASEGEEGPSSVDDEYDHGSESVGVENTTASNFGQRIGREDITEEMLRQALFRYALYLSYVYQGEGESPQLWVVRPKQWAGQI